MNERFEEQTAIFFSILKWIALAVIIGILVGLSTTVFLKLLNISSDFGKSIPYYFVSLPLVFVLSTWIINKLAPNAKGHGTEKVIEAIHRRSGRVPILVVPVKLFTTIITLAAGGSVGKEGPCGQIGAGLASFFSDIFRLKDADRKKLAICGISAGFAAVFGTPISGAIFGLEVLYVGAVMYDVMLPSFISGIIAYQVCTSFGIHYFHSNISFTPAFSQSFFLKVMLAGIFFGIVSFLFIESFRFTEKKVERWKLNEYARNFIGGSILVGLIFVFSTRYCGLGISVIENLLNTGEKAFWYGFLLKILFTIATLAFGGSGGIVTPTFFIGATAGSLFAQIMGLDTATFAAIGMVSLLSGAANTPIAASIMGVELFGGTLAPYAAISCVLAFLMTGHRSIYPSQILSIAKSPTVHVDMGKEMHDVEASVNMKERYTLYRFWKKWRLRK
ncbi:MAG TPA: chloride channel protein [Bacteroidia bacterium]|nr:chloride channel protein [Bacteroidia bacterium]